MENQEVGNGQEWCDRLAHRNRTLVEIASAGVIRYRAMMSRSCVIVASVCSKRLVFAQPCLGCWILSNWAGGIIHGSFYNHPRQYEVVFPAEHIDMSQLSTLFGLALCKWRYSLVESKIFRKLVPQIDLRWPFLSPSFEFNVILTKALLMSTKQLPHNSCRVQSPVKPLATTVPFLVFGAPEPSPVPYINTNLPRPSPRIYIKNPHSSYHAPRTTCHLRGGHLSGKGSARARTAHSTVPHQSLPFLATDAAKS